MKKLKKIIAAGAVIFLIITGYMVLDYLTVDDSASYTRLMLHEFYEQDNIDILMVGASHCYRGTVPSIVGEKTGKNVFDASSANQRPDASLVLVKEAIDLYDVEHVYLELSRTIADTTGIYFERTDMTSTYLVSDYMRPSAEKYRFLLNASSPEHYMNSFFKVKRECANLFDWGYVGNLMDIKNSEAYKSYAYDYAVHEDEWYVGNGYVACIKAKEKSGYYVKDGYDPINTDDISEDWRNSVEEIIDVCKKNNVELTLYAAPISNFELAGAGNYDEYISYVKDMLAGQVEFVDFNLISADYFPYDEGYYMDSHHLNMYGAELFSSILGDYMNGNLPDTAFCDSVSEKIDADAAAYYGITYKQEVTDEGEMIRNMRLVSNHPEELEYRIVLTPEDGESYMVQDFDSNNELSVPWEQSGLITVSYRIITDPDNVITVTYRIIITPDNKITAERLC